MIFGLSLIFPLVGYLMQVFPRLFNRYYGVDVWMRMIEADLIRKNDHKIPKGIIKDQFLLEGYFNYPPFLPWLLSFFPKKTLLETQGFIAPFFDALHNVLIFFIVYTLTQRVEIALFAQALYTTIPLVILENSYLTPRSLGYLLFTLSFYPLILYSVNPNPLLVLLSVGAMTLCCFSHKFALQSLFFCTISFALIELNGLYIGVFLLSLLIATLISRGFYLRILSEHLGYIKFSSKIIKYRFSHQVRGFAGSKKADLVGSIYKVLGTFAPLTVLASNIWIIPSVLIIIDQVLAPKILTLSPLIVKLSIWVVFFYVLSILVLTIPFLRAIGEGQRYMEMGTVPSVIVAAITFYTLVNTELGSFIVFIFLSIFIIHLGTAFFLQIKAVVKDRNRTKTRSMDKIFLFINKMKPKPNILCIPHQITTMVLFNTNANVLVDIQPTTAIKIWDIYPVLRIPLKEIAKKFNVNLLVLKKDYASLEELAINKRAVLFETDDTAICKI